jgi:uncharacterized lipoprotein YajG
MKPIYTFVLLCALMMASCQETGNPKDTNTTTAPANTFDIVVGTTTYKIENEQIEEQEDIILRGHSNQLAVITYLNNVADGVASVINVTDAIKGEKTNHPKRMVKARPHPHKRNTQPRKKRQKPR